MKQYRVIKEVFVKADSEWEAEDKAITSKCLKTDWTLIDVHEITDDTFVTLSVVSEEGINEH
jgi:hypothetical protein